MTFLEELVQLMKKHDVELVSEMRLYIHEDGDEEIVGTDWEFRKNGHDGYLDMETISEACDYEDT